MLSFLDALLLQPLMAIYGWIYAVLPGSMHPGVKLIVFSVVINLVLMPVYFQMEQQSRRLRSLKDRVAQDVQRIRRNFSGRERFFYVRAVHRQHGYHPISALFGSYDLFLQILVFATVFRFLSGLDALDGQSFGVIVDLGRPDGLLGGVNALPLLMTAINLLSVFAYTGDSSGRRQAMLLAGLFLVLLYQSPAGLVLYWTANNVFSLMRNVVARSSRDFVPIGIARRMRAIGGLQ